MTEQQPAASRDAGARIGSYRDLRVWKRSFDLSLEVYRATRQFPKSELYGLTGQMRRAAVSVPSNVAEGYGRRTTAEYMRAVNIAYGSTCELETQVMLADELGYLSSESAASLRKGIGEVERMLAALARALARRRSAPDPRIPAAPDPASRPARQNKR